LQLSVVAMGAAPVVPQFAIAVISSNVSVLGPASPAPVAPAVTAGGPYLVQLIVGKKTLQPLTIDGLGVERADSATSNAKPGASCKSFKVLFQVDDVPFVYQWYNESVGLKPEERVKANERRVEVRLQPTNDDLTVPFAMIEGVRLKTFDPFVGLPQGPNVTGISAEFDCTSLTLAPTALR
jgi:hypothetical protein